jgi:hypothetical protein
MRNLMNAGAVIIVWVCVAIITAILLGVYVVVGGVYLSVTWPWYLWRGARRIALPR